MDFFWDNITHAPIWIAAAQIIGVNIILSGDNAVVIAMACMTLPPKQRLWGMIMGAGVAVLLRVVFTLVVAEAMNYPFLKLVGGVLLFWVATKLVTEDSEGEGVKSGETLWSAVRIVAIADIVMSLDNVIAIAASAEMAAGRVDLAHAASIKTALIIFGLATSVPLIVAGSALLMALLSRFRVLVWAGGALLGWVAGDIMATDPFLAGQLSEGTMNALHVWGGPVGALIVVSIGYLMVRRHRQLYLDEIMAGVGLVAWIVVDRVSAAIFGGQNPDLAKIWGVRGALVVVLATAYVVARKRWHVEKVEA
ncbi:MAG: TerC family protein [Pseudolabrys sp.]|nr:TerC family protein [Pseudolabrys sp.]